MSDDIDLFGPLEEPDAPAFAVHTITVLQVEYEEPSEADVFGIDPIDVQFQINHGHCDLRGIECIVEEIVGEIGLHQAMFGVWDKDHRLEVRDYRVRGWTSYSPATPNGPEEYDAGIEEVDDDAAL